MGHDDPADDDTDHDHPTGDDTGHDEPADDDTGHDEPADDDTDHDHPTGDDTGHDEPADDDTGHDEPADDDTGHDHPTGDDTGHDEPADDGTGHDEPADDDTGHDHSMGGSDPIVLPQTQEEIDAFVAAVRAAPEMHSHDHGSSMASEHMAAMDLVARDDATHIAIGHGDWDDPANWHNGEVPGDDARVLIPDGVHMTYDHVNEARLFTVRVDGKLEFSTEVNSQMIVDTIVVSSNGMLQIGTESDPVAADVNVDIIFANNGPIDTNWDPMLLSRGMIAHGKVDIHGSVKDSHAKVVDDPMAGDTWVDMGDVPEGWAVGDTIVIAGTHYEGYLNWDPEAGYVPPEDEIRVITEISDGMIFFDEPLIHDHDSPREDLKTSVANYTRNVSFETENAEFAEVYERGHVMFMHNDDVDVRYAEFHELGRTDKSELSANVSQFDSIEFDTNVKGRYAFHFHRAGLDDQDNPAMAVGNAVYGSPGWGFVHHDSNAILDNNATYDTFGAGYVAESGNETGAWTDNIAIYAKGVAWQPPKIANNLDLFDLGATGDGFWFQSRMVESSDNIAASVNHGFVYFHRGKIRDDQMLQFDSEVSDIEGALSYRDAIAPDDHPILEFYGNETIASRVGLHVVKANPNQGHDVHSVLEDFTAWNVERGAELEYTAHYTLLDFDLIGEEGRSETAISFGNNLSDIAVVDPTIENFTTGLSLHKSFTVSDWDPEQHEYTVVNPTFINVLNENPSFDPALDTLYQTDELPLYTPDIILDEPLVYRDGSPTTEDWRTVTISGTKRDGLGETEFASGTDDYNLYWDQVMSTLKSEGFYSTSEGETYFNYDLYFSDRLTGDIYVETHPVFVEGVDVWWFAQNGEMEYHGVQDFGVEGDQTSDAAKLWATLTEGQLVLSETDALPQEEDPDLLLDAG